MAVSSSTAYSIYHYLDQNQLMLIDDILFYLPPGGCKKRDPSRAINIILSEPIHNTRDVAYIKSMDQSIKGVVIYEMSSDKKFGKKHKLSKTLYVCYGKLKWRRIC